MYKYNFLIIGAGLSGAVAAHILTNEGYKVLVIDKRPHTGGNCYCETVNNIIVHKYGAHIFHTPDKFIWDFITKFTEFNSYIHQVTANYNGELYNLPFNIFTFNKIYPEIKTPDDLLKILKQECIKKEEYKNLEEYAIGNVGKRLYEILIKGYTEKQWNRKCNDLSPEIIKRIPIRFNFNNNYFEDPYQGVPVNGYNEIFDKLLQYSEVRLNTEYFENKKELDKLAEYIIYTGPIDRFFDYKFGKLDYRSLKFDTKILNTPNYQGNSVINYTSGDIPYTRIIEHKHFHDLNNKDIYSNPDTVITYEYPDAYTGTNEPYYPVLNSENIERYNSYKELGDECKNILFIGRLAEYKYFDMDDTIINVFNKIKESGF